MTLSTLFSLRPEQESTSLVLYSSISSLLLWMRYELEPTASSSTQNSSSLEKKMLPITMQEVITPSERKSLILFSIESESWLTSVLVFKVCIFQIFGSHWRTLEVTHTLLILYSFIIVSRFLDLPFLRRRNWFWLYFSSYGTLVRWLWKEIQIGICNLSSTTSNIHSLVTGIKYSDAMSMQNLNNVKTIF